MRQTADLEIDGFGRCIDKGCVMFDVLDPVKLVKTTVEIRGTDGPGDLFRNLVLNVTEYLHLVDDADGFCPECGKPRALLDQKPIVHPLKYGSPA